MIRQKVQVWIYTYNPVTRDYAFLVLFTIPTRGGFWQPVTGSVEGQENLETAALRESQEETGLLFKGPPQPLGEPFEFKSQWGGDVREYGFSLEASVSENQRLPAVQVDPQEHSAYRWVSANEALKMLAYPSNMQMLRSLLKKLGVSVG